MVRSSELKDKKAEAENQNDSNEDFGH
jgi:hypothetical protein